MVKKISTIELKRIAREIITSEEDKYTISINVRPITFMDIISLKDSGYSMQRRKSDFGYYTDLNCGGYNDLNGTTVIFLDKLDRLSRRRQISNIFLLVSACYHEARHSEQQFFDKYSYARFLFDIERVYMQSDSSKDYNHNHNDYSFEIGANLYGIEMAREYLKKNYPKVYEEDKDKIDILEESFLVDYKLYNPTYFIDMVIPRIRNIRPLDDNKKVKDIKDKSLILSIFLNDDGSIKRPREILNNRKYLKLDKIIIYAVYSSLSFLNELTCIDDLTEEEISIINEAIEYTSELCENQRKYFNELMVRPNDNAIIQNEKIMYVNLYLLKIQLIRDYLKDSKGFKRSRKL